MNCLQKVHSLHCKNIKKQQREFEIKMNYNHNHNIKIIRVGLIKCDKVLIIKSKIFSSNNRKIIRDKKFCEYENQCFIKMTMN